MLPLYITRQRLKRTNQSHATKSIWSTPGPNIQVSDGQYSLIQWFIRPHAKFRWNDWCDANYSFGRADEKRDRRIHASAQGLHIAVDGHFPAKSSGTYGRLNVLAFLCPLESFPTVLILRCDGSPRTLGCRSRLWSRNWPRHRCLSKCTRISTINIAPKFETWNAGKYVHIKW